MKKKVVIIGYSGHAFVVCDIVYKNNDYILGYCDLHQKDINPYNLKYLGHEKDYVFDTGLAFIAVGDNALRQKIHTYIHSEYYTAIHPSSILGHHLNIGEGSMVGPNAVINPMVEIGAFVIINSGAIIEHECSLSSYSHIGPGAVLAGGVSVGDRSFVGANAVVREGVSIGSDVKIGAGTVIIRDVPNDCTVVGNPGRILD